MTATGSPTRAVTPTVRQWFRSTRFWIVLVAGLIVVATVWTFVNAGIRNSDPLAADNPGPSGGMALAEVLRQQGVDVTAADTFAEAQAAAADPADTTVLLFDQGFFLDPDRIAELRRLADRLVVVAPTSELLSEYAPDVAFAGVPDTSDPVAPKCDLPAATRAGSVTAGQSSLQPAGDTTSGAVFCYPDASDAFLLAQTESAGLDVTLLADAEPFDNQHVTSAGNAALALNLLGSTPTLVWYVPGILDVAGSGGAEPTIANLTPEWVTPVLTLLLAVFVAAAVWRGRRLGPLVVENLPVVVPSRETMEGRARLYQRSSARRRALDALRVGAIGRIATALALARTASVEEVVRAAAASTGRSADDVRRVLLDGDPDTDATLVSLSDALQKLERDVRSATDPRHATGRMDR